MDKSRGYTPQIRVLPTSPPLRDDGTPYSPQELDEAMSRVVTYAQCRTYNAGFRMPSLNRTSNRTLIVPRADDCPLSSERR